MARGPFGPVLASVSCSLVAEAITTTNPIRYSRRKCWYAYFAAHIDEPVMSYRKIVPAIDLLIEQGWAEGVKGIHLPNRQGKQSIAWATRILVHRLTPLIVLDHRRAPEPDEALVLRDKDRRMLPVPDTEATRCMRDELDDLNAAYASHEWALRGRKIDIPALRRIFSQTMFRGGRGYHHGPSYQQLPKEERAQITLDVNGVQWPTVEVDYPALHIRMAYAEAGAQMPNGDAYDLPGFDRNRECKPALNTLLNASDEKEALGVIGGTLLGDNYTRGRDLISALKAKHPALVPSFGSDAGARFQRADSDMAIRVALGVLARTGRPPLIVHDSFIVAICDQDALAVEMSLALSTSLKPLTPFPQALRQVLPRASEVPPSLSPIHMGNHPL